MSNQTTAQRVRRNGGSPSTSKQGPIKAVQAFSLKQASSKNSQSQRDCNKLWTRKSPDHRLSPERKSPNSTSPRLSPNSAASVSVSQQTSSTCMRTQTHHTHTHHNHSHSHSHKGMV